MTPKDIFGIALRCAGFFFLLSALQGAISRLVSAAFAHSWSELIKNFGWSEVVSSLTVGLLVLFFSPALERLAYPKK